jgi:hypothetical protein
MPGRDRLAQSTPGRRLLRRSRRVLRDPGFPPAVGVGALLLFSWPILRVPPPSLLPACVHLFVAWALVILTLALLARALAPGVDDRERDG